jgi:hypothetical protein
MSLTNISFSSSSFLSLTQSPLTHRRIKHYSSFSDPPPPVDPVWFSFSPPSSSDGEWLVHPRLPGCSPHQINIKIHKSGEGSGRYTPDIRPHHSHHQIDSKVDEIGEVSSKLISRLIKAVRGVVGAPLVSIPTILFTKSTPRWMRWEKGAVGARLVSVFIILLSKSTLRLVHPYASFLNWRHC